MSRWMMRRGDSGMGKCNASRRGRARGTSSFPPPDPRLPLSLLLRAGATILAASNSNGSVPCIPFGLHRFWFSPTDNLMPRVLLRVATSYIESIHAYRYREMVQSQQGFRLHPARRQVQGRIRTHLGGGTRRPRQSQREPEDRLRARARAERQDVRGRFEGGLTAPRPSLADPQMCYRDRSKGGASWPCTARSTGDI